MHFIQNSWFTHNWIILLLLLVGSLAVVAYINDKKNLMKYTSASFLILFVFVVCFLLLPEVNHSLSLNSDLLPSLKVEKSEDNISAFSRIIQIVLDILKDKLRD